jgi:ABC-type sugar transport system ATPase subunit
MLGSSEAGGRVRPVTRSTQPPMLTVKGIGRSGALHDINFTLRPGEVVGLWGLLGSGRTELLRCLVGLDRADNGELLWAKDGRETAIAPEVLRYQVGLVTEDRRGEGLHLPLSVAQNISLPNLRKVLGPLRLVSASREAGLADEMIARLKIKVSDRQQTVATLSGGNQQKVVFAKWLATDPQLLLLDEPPRGLDVSAKSEILRLVADLAAQGCSVLLVSSELEELIRVCDRYLVMSRGRLVHELSGDASSSELMDAIAMGSAAEAA